MKRRAVSFGSERGYNSVMENKEVELVEKSLSLPVQIHSAAEKKSTIDLVELATEIQKVDSFIQVSACSKLQTISTQIRCLQEQAINVLKEASTNTKLHHAACNFKKVPGKTYHFYQKQTGQTYFSMLSPKEWGTLMRDEFLGSYRLELDLSWTLVARENEMVLEDKILNSCPGVIVYPNDEEMMIEN